MCTELYIASYLPDIYTYILIYINIYNSISHFCLIAGVEPLDCGYRVVGSLLLLLAISEIIPGSAGTLGDCRMSQFIHYV